MFMKKEFLFLLSFIIVIGSAIGVSMIVKSFDSADADPTGEAVSNEKSDTVVVPQLDSEERANSATMVLVGSPPVLPDDHANFWNPEIGYESCMLCHAPEVAEGVGAVVPTPNHFYDDDIEKGVFRDYCIQCHVSQNDSKSSFNE